MGKWATQVRRGKGVSPATEDKKQPCVVCVYMSCVLSTAKMLLPYCFIISTLLVKHNSRQIQKLIIMGLKEWIVGVTPGFTSRWEAESD